MDKLDSKNVNCDFEGGSFCSNGVLNVVSLYGDWHQMGRQYGFLTRHLLQEVLSFVVGMADTPQKRERIESTAQKLFSRYPDTLRSFFDGMRETSGLSLDDLCLINAVEYAEPDYMCSVMAAFDGYSEGPLVLGRNYDGMSFRPLAGDLLLTVFHPLNALSAAIIGYAGEIYCVNGFNEKGLFVELNNGMPSAGFEIHYEMNASTTELLTMLFDVHDMDEVDRFFGQTSSFSSLIIGVADAHEARSYEWCTAGVRRSDGHLPHGLTIHTNHYVHPDWTFPQPDDAQSWQSLTRRCNLVSKAEKFAGRWNPELMRSLMQTPIAEGGPMFDKLTLYQLVVEPETMRVWMRIPDRMPWVEIDMADLLR